MYYGQQPWDFEFEEVYMHGMGALGAMGPKQKKCVNSGGSWEGPKGKKTCVYRAGESGGVPTTPAGKPVPTKLGKPRPVSTSAPTVSTPKAGSTVYGPIPTQWIGTEKTGAAGPAQKKCENQGGHWIGPNKKRWCQIPPGASAPSPSPAPAPAPAPAPSPSVQGGLTPEQQAYLASVGNPSAGSTVVGVPPPPGLFPPFKGAVGPKQKKCTKSGGTWDGPLKKKFCIMPPAPVLPPPVLPPPIDQITPDQPVETPPSGPSGPSPLEIAREKYQACLAKQAQGYKIACRNPDSGIVQQPPPPQNQVPDVETYPDQQGPYGPPTTPSYTEYPQGPSIPDYGAGSAGPYVTPIAPGYDTSFVDPGAGAGAGAGGAQVAPQTLAECDPSFAQLLPMVYSDEYGSMEVLQVVCGSATQKNQQQQGAGPLGARPVADIEQTELDQLFA